MVRKRLLVLQLEIFAKNNRYFIDHILYRVEEYLRCVGALVGAKVGFPVGDFVGGLVA